MRVALPTALLCAALAISVRAQTTAYDCVPPLMPELSASAELLRDYADEIRGEFNAYFDESQRYLNCLAAAQQSAQAEIKDVLEAYQALFAE